MPAHGQAAALGGLLDQVVGDQLPRRGSGEVQDLRREGNPTDLGVHVRSGPAGRTDPQVQRAVDDAGTRHVEVTGGHEGDVSRHRFGHPVVVDGHDVRRSPQPRHAGEDSGARAPHAFGDLRVVAGGLLVRGEHRVSKAIDHQAIDTLDLTVQDDDTGDSLQVVVEGDRVVVAPDEHVWLAEGRDAGQDELVLNVRPERREIAGIEYEVDVEGLGDLLGERQPEGREVDVGDVQDSDLIVSRLGERLDRAVHAHRPRKNARQLGAKVVDLVESRLGRTDQLGCQRQRPRVARGEESVGMIGPPRQGLASPHGDQGCQQREGNRSPPSSKDEQRQDERAGHGHTEQPEGEGDHLFQGVHLHLIDQTLRPPLPDRFGQLVQPHALQGGLEAKRRQVRVGGEVTERRKRDDGVPPPEPAAQEDLERSHRDRALSP